MRFVTYALVAFALGACCPAPTAPGAPLALRAEVVGAAPASEQLYVRSQQGGPISSISVAGASLRAADGAPLPWSALQAGGAEVYLTGGPDGAVREVRLLGPLP
ncbi:hypothetical protein [Truepera radiovictrix]|uniref:Dolichyl-phosphate-mannose--protein mannosyltransferase putative membrane protein n=1 Tax=Truepera radiovictrix (strain DSM 17093 / CIP 108686 / LMG 22925 / RQ-24) TaxID=649638 RepID=D7CTC8_TRURR|nr:hypothetical protein [Truepera radiovictrix]ADI13785.1 putative dolichyl-phosphate-mannose--protein mannosyltransferase; putative membrane protein [Truepera radiovictrix DSM 17093]WMT57649.1 hypothetical protein RCV51_01575 [Truepera radiovictrix]